MNREIPAESQLNNRETERLHSRLLVTIERADFLESVMQSRDQM